MEKERNRISKEIALYHINSVLGTTLDDFKEKSRKREIVDDRKIAGYILYKYTDLTYDDIAELFGLKDHASIIHYCNSIHDLRDSEFYIRDALFKIESRIIYVIYPSEKVSRDEFVATIFGLIVWDEMGTTRRNIEDYYYSQLVKLKEEEKWQTKGTNLKQRILRVRTT